MATLLALIETLPAPVFVHCRYGCDRAGTIIACYRIRHDHWSNEAALEEARKYGLSILEQGMISYIRTFGKAPTQEQAAATK
jgi:protein tyrosine/serine phosphatase